jgi:ADP-ribosylglycohydrolase
MIDGPIVCRWEGDVMRPIGRFAAEADRRFVIGLTYALDEILERSSASHAHYFAQVNDLWHSLPEHLAERFPTAAALRAHALIETGHHNETRLDAGTNAAAMRVAAIMQADEPLAAVVVRGPLVVRRIARSQSYRAMDKGEFQTSKDDVLQYLADLVGADAKALEAVR